MKRQKYLTISKNVKNQMVAKLKAWVTNNGNCDVVIGISGGKDSTVVAGLCVEALGKDRVIGVLMPNGTQKDIEDSKRVCKYLKIKNITVNILGAYNDITTYIMDGCKEAGIHTQYDQSRMTTNLPPRLRMSTLYAVAQAIDGRVINTSNASEGYVGWGTLAGDVMGDFAPIKNLFVDEVIDLGRQLGLPEDLLVKPPADGLTAKTDEDNLGFTYASVKEVALKPVGWIETVSMLEKDKIDLGKTELDIIKEIEDRHLKSQFKRDLINIPSIEFWRDSVGKRVFAVK